MLVGSSGWLCQARSLIAGMWMNASSCHIPFFFVKWEW